MSDNPLRDASVVLTWTTLVQPTLAIEHAATARQRDRGHVTQTEVSLHDGLAVGEPAYPAGAPSYPHECPHAARYRRFDRSRAGVFCLAHGSALAAKRSVSQPPLQRRGQGFDSNVRAQLRLAESLLSARGGYRYRNYWGERGPVNPRHSICCPDGLHHHQAGTLRWS